MASASTASKKTKGANLYTFTSSTFIKAMSFSEAAEVCYQSIVDRDAATSGTVANDFKSFFLEEKPSAAACANIEESCYKCTVRNRKGLKPGTSNFYAVVKTRSTCSSASAAVDPFPFYQSRADISTCTSFCTAVVSDDVYCYTTPDGTFYSVAGLCT